MVRGSVILAVFAANFFSSVHSSNGDAYHIELLSPRGFRVFVSAPIIQSNSDTAIPFDCLAYEYMGQPRRYRGYAGLGGYGVAVYENNDAVFDLGHTIVFRLKSMSELDDVQNGYTITIKIPPDTPRVPV